MKQKQKQHSTEDIIRILRQADWIKPIVLLLTVIVMQKINSLSLGYVLFRITNDIEKLPYPLASVQAGGATALAESSGAREGWRWVSGPLARRALSHSSTFSCQTIRGGSALFLALSGRQSTPTLVRA